MFGQVRQTAFFRIFFSVIILLITVISCLTLGFTAVFETILEDFLVKTYISNLHIIKENYTRLQYTFIPAAFNVYENEAVQDYLFARRGDQEAALYALTFIRFMHIMQHTAICPLLQVTKEQFAQAIRS